jgi:hypothetical protein
MNYLSLALAAILAASGQDQVVQPAAPPPSPSGKIVMYRGSSVVGAAVGCPIRYKGQEVVELGRGRYAEWSVPAGRYILTNHTTSVEVAVDPGETRYVRCMIKMGMLTGRADLQIVDEESFNEHRTQFELKAVNSISIPANRAGPAQGRD